MKAERIAHWVEIVANVGVIITLILLAAEVRNNTLTLERQALLDRSSAMNSPFLENPAMAEILADIKAVDGWDGAPYEEAFSTRYGVPIESAIIWGRHLSMVWAGLNADYTLSGESPDLAARIRILLSFPDNQLLWEHAPGLFTEDFRAYVGRVQEDAR